MGDKLPSVSPAGQHSGYTPGDDFTTQWSNAFSLMMGRMSEEGKIQYMKARHDQTEAQDCRKCEQHRDWLLQWSMTSDSSGALDPHC